MSILLVGVVQDFTVRGVDSGRELHRRAEAVMAGMVTLSDAGVILDGSASVDSTRDVVQLGVTVRTSEFQDGVIQAVTAMRNAIHAAGDATPGWSSSEEFLEAVASTIHAERT